MRVRALGLDDRDSGDFVRDGPVRVTPDDHVDEAFRQRARELEDLG